MRSIIMLAAALLALACPAGAQEQNWEVSVGAGFIPFWGFEEAHGYYSVENTLAGQYSPKYVNGDITPWIGVTGMRLINERFSLGASLGTARIADRFKDPLSETEYTVNRLGISLMACGRMSYHNWKRVSLYGGAAIGIAAMFSSAPERSFKMVPGYELVPFGIYAGKRVTVYYEYVLGNTLMGARAGLAYKF